MDPSTVLAVTDPRLFSVLVVVCELFGGKESMKKYHAKGRRLGFEAIII